MIIEPDFVMEHWPLSQVTFGSSFPSYPSRKVFLVHSSSGNFVAKVAPAPERESDSLKALSVLEHLNKADFAHAPALLPTRAGAGIALYEGHTVCLMEYIPEPLPDIDHNQANTWRDLGAVAARLNAFQDFEPPFAVPIGEALEEMSLWMKDHSFEGQFAGLQDRLSELLTAKATGLIHGEINGANARRREDGTAVLLDWDQAGTGRLALEMGYPLVTVFVSEENLVFYKEPARAFYGSYASEGGIIDRPVIFSAAIFHALRYMRFGDISRRWRRIQHALEHEDDLCSVIP